AFRLEASAQGGGIEQADVDAVAYPLLEGEGPPVRRPGEDLAVAAGVVGDRAAARPGPHSLRPGRKREDLDRRARPAAPTPHGDGKLAAVGGERESRYVAPGGLGRDVQWRQPADVTASAETEQEELVCGGPEECSPVLAGHCHPRCGEDEGVIVGGRDSTE